MNRGNIEIVSFFIVVEGADYDSREVEKAPTTMEHIGMGLQSRLSTVTEGSRGDRPMDPLLALQRPGSLKSRKVAVVITTPTSLKWPMK